MSEIAARLKAAVDPPAVELVSIFFDRTGPFAGTTFDDLPDNAGDRCNITDLLAVTLLDMRFRSKAVRALLDDRADELRENLSRIPGDVGLWDTTDDRLV